MGWSHPNFRKGAGAPSAPTVRAIRPVCRTWPSGSAGWSPTSYCVEQALTKANRLLVLLAALRGRRPVTGERLARELGISKRTLYRDIQDLRSLGAAIDGSPGFGYVMAPGFLLPPLRFSEDEMDALILGARLVAERADDALAEAGRRALSKILDLAPEPAETAANACGLVAGSADPDLAADPHTALVRQAIREERYADISYTDAQGAQTVRRVKPIALGFFDHCHLMAAWCTLREDFRHFRIDRLTSFAIRRERYKPPQRTLLALWRRIEDIPFQA